MKLILSGTSYFAALSHVEPEAVTPVLAGCRVTLIAPDADTYEQWVDLLAAAACDLADDGNDSAKEAIYKDIERNDALRPVPA